MTMARIVIRTALFNLVIFLDSACTLSEFYNALPRARRVTWNEPWLPRGIMATT